MLQFITHQNDRYTTIAGAQQALEGGCRWIQLRMKDVPTETVRGTAVELKNLCREYGATFIIDDHVELTAEVGADGVHIGKNDMPPTEARRILGDKFIIGGTANTFEDVERLYAQGVNYIGLGPFRFTETKKNLSPILGLAGYKHIAERCQEKGIVLPIVAIGGITADDIPSLMQTGIAGIALSGSILRAENPAKETQRIIRIINNYTL